jgi:hypothetical protein
MYLLRMPASLPFADLCQQESILTQELVTELLHGGGVAARRGTTVALHSACSSSYYGAVIASWWSFIHVHKWQQVIGSVDSNIHRLALVGVSASPQ